MLQNTILNIQADSDSYSACFSCFVGDRDRYSLPEDLTILHAEFTYFYYPGDIPFPCKWYSVYVFFTSSVISNLKVYSVSHFIKRVLFMELIL
jgi:hypothetical protein